MKLYVLQSNTASFLLTSSSIVQILLPYRISWLPFCFFHHITSLCIVYNIQNNLFSILPIISFPYTSNLHFLEGLEPRDDSDLSHLFIWAQTTSYCFTLLPIQICHHLTWEALGLTSGKIDMAQKPTSSNIPSIISLIWLCNCLESLEKTERCVSLTRAKFPPTQVWTFMGGFCIPRVPTFSSLTWFWQLTSNVCFFVFERHGHLSSSYDESEHLYPSPKRESST